MDSPWERCIRDIAITVSDDRRHRGAVKAVLDSGEWLQSELIIHHKSPSENRMFRDRHAVYQGKDWRLIRHWTQRSRWPGRVSHLKHRRNALRPDVHNFIDAGEAVPGTPSNRTNRANRDLSKQRVVGDIIDT